jgi:hypothetical protein
MPVCTRCKIDLPESAFGFSHRKARAGRKERIERKAHCKDCLKKDRVEYRLKAHDKLRLSATDYRAKHGLDIAEKRRLAKLMQPERFRASQRKHNLKIKTEVLSHYSNGSMKCVCCGESIFEFLTIDHINGGGNKHRKSFSGSFYEWLKKNGFPQGYQVLCYNCNCGKRQNQVCPHLTCLTIP